jgi:hypothetical protein
VLFCCYWSSSMYCLCVPGGSVGMATDHNLGGPVSNPGGEEVFRPFTPALGHSQPSLQWVPVVSRGKVRPERAADHSPLLFLSPTWKETSLEPCRGHARFQQHPDASCHQVFFLQGKAPREFHTAILKDTLVCFLPGRAMDLSALLYISPSLPTV